MKSREYSDRNGCALVGDATEADAQRPVLINTPVPGSLARGFLFSWGRRGVRVFVWSVLADMHLGYDLVHFGGGESANSRGVDVTQGPQAQKCGQRCFIIRCVLD